MKKVCALIIIFTGFILAVNQVQAAPPIKIGFLDVRSGPFKSNGDKFLVGFETAVKQINEEGGILGQPLEIVEEDHQMKPEIAVQKLKKLILKDKVEAVIGGSTSACCLAISKAMPRYKKIYMPTGFAMDITGKSFNPYVFRSFSNVAILAKSMAQYISKHTQLKKVYLINQDYSYGHDVADIYEKFIKEAVPGAEIVGKDFHPMFNKDFAPYISKIKASDADYVLTGNWGMDGSQLIIQGRSLGMNLPIAGFALADPNNLGAMPGNEAVGSLGMSTYLSGVDTPKAKKFEESFYKISGGKWPTEQQWFGYQIMMMYAKAVNKAGSLDIEKVIKTFEGLTWEGPVGTVTMRAKDHQAIQPMVIGQVVEKTKYFDFPYMKPIQVIPSEQTAYKPEDFGWKHYKER